MGEVKPHVQQIAAANQHEVLYTPPHYSDLQPIEMVWAHIKGRIARRYQKGTTLKDVEARLNSEFATLGRVGPDGSHIVAKIIKNVDPLLQKHWDEIQADEEQEAQRDAAQILAELREEDEDDAFEQPVLEHGGNFA